MYSKFYKLIFIAIISLIVLFNGCEFKKHSIGDFERIIAFMDSSLIGDVEPALEQVFDHYVYTPHMEKSFYIAYESLENLETYRSRRNLIFLSLLGSDDEVSTYVNKLLSEDAKKAISEDRAFYFFNRDVFMRDQMVIFLIAKSKEQMINNLKVHGDEIFKKLDEYHFERLARAMFIEGEQTELENYLARKYGWSVRIQYDYQVVRDNKEGNFFQIKRVRPARNLFVFRFKSDSLITDEKRLIQIRDSLSALYFESDSVLTDDTYMSIIDFKGKKAVKLTGIWQNEKYYLGGPFRSFIIHDNKTGFLYFIDIHVIAPGKRKKPYLDQLEVMARSFYLVHE